MEADEIQRLINAEADAVRHIPVTRQYEQAVNLIYNAVHVFRGKVITSGMGKAGQVAKIIASKFSSTGTAAVFLHPAEAQHGDLGVLQQHDVLLMISNSGETREVIELAELARKMFPAILMILITGNAASSLSYYATVEILTGCPDEICPLRLTPTTSTTVMNVIGDVLVMLMMKKINFTREQYAKRHHGGYIGKMII